MNTHQEFFYVEQVPMELWPATLNYRPEFNAQGIFTGLGKPGKDSYKYGFVCDVDENGKVVKVRYDGMMKHDGPVGPDGHATPSAVMVTAERRPDGVYLYCGRETRVFIYDHVAKVKGPEVVGFSGGFTEKGKTPAETALTELLQEHGIHVKKAEIVRIGHASDNRAMTNTCIEYYLGIFERQEGQSLGDDEMIRKIEPIRVDRFVPGVDGIVDTAYAFLIHRLGLVAPLPIAPDQTDQVSRFLQLLDEQPAVANLMLNLVEMTKGAPKPE